MASISGSLDTMSVPQKAYIRMLSRPYTSVRPSMRGSSASRSSDGETPARSRSAMELAQTARTVSQVLMVCSSAEA